MSVLKEMGDRKMVRWWSTFFYRQHYKKNENSGMRKTCVFEKKKLVDGSD